MLFSLFGIACTSWKNGNDGQKKFIPTFVQVLFCLIGIVITVIAVQIASKCNPNNSLLYGILALLFPELYLIQFGIRRFVLHQEGYCHSIPGETIMDTFQNASSIQLP